MAFLAALRMLDRFQVQPLSGFAHTSHDTVRRSQSYPTIRGSSVSQWMGTHWEVLVDLWTIESGRSDLVLTVFVLETTDGFRFEIDSVHVP